MELREIIDHLAQNELSQISIKGQEQGVINGANIQSVINNINLALTALHKRFNLRENRLIIHLSPDISFYRIAQISVGKEDADRTKKPLEVDTKVFPIKDSLIKILEVYADSGQAIPLNDKSDPLSVHTPRFDLLEVPKLLLTKDNRLEDRFITDHLHIRYKANHPRLGKYGPDGELEIASLDDLDGIEVDIPYAYLEPLCYWVASRYHNPIGMGQEFNAGNTYYAKYENACQQLELEGMQTDNSVRGGFRREGWV